MGLLCVEDALGVGIGSKCGVGGDPSADPSSLRSAFSAQFDRAALGTPLPLTMDAVSSAKEESMSSAVQAAGHVVPAWGF